MTALFFLFYIQFSLKTNGLPVLHIDINTCRTIGKYFGSEFISVFRITCDELDNGIPFFIHFHIIFFEDGFEVKSVTSAIRDAIGPSIIRQVRNNRISSDCQSLGRCQRDGASAHRHGSVDIYLIIFRFN